jgi:hypothetical protein
MKALRFLPLVYLVGVHGFVFFAPYIALLLAAAYAMRIFRRDAQPVPVRVISRRFPFARRRD